MERIELFSVLDVVEMAKAQGIPVSRTSLYKWLERRLVREPQHVKGEARAFTRDEADEVLAVAKRRADARREFFLPERGVAA